MNRLMIKLLVQTGELSPEQKDYVVEAKQHILLYPGTAVRKPLRSDRGDHPVGNGNHWDERL